MDDNEVYAYVVRDSDLGTGCYLNYNDHGQADFGPLLNAYLIADEDVANEIALRHGAEFVRVRLEVL